MFTRFFFSAGICFFQMSGNFKTLIVPVLLLTIIILSDKNENCFSCLEKPADSYSLEKPKEIYADFSLKKPENTGLLFHISTNNYIYEIPPLTLIGKNFGTCNTDNNPADYWFSPRFGLDFNAVNGTTGLNNILSFFPGMYSGSVFSFAVQYANDSRTLKPPFLSDSDYYASSQIAICLNKYDLNSLGLNFKLILDTYNPNPRDHSYSNSSLAGMDLYANTAPGPFFGPVELNANQFINCGNIGPFYSHFIIGETIGFTSPYINGILLQNELHKGLNPPIPGYNWYDKPAGPIIGLSASYALSVTTEGSLWGGLYHLSAAAAAMGEAGYNMNCSIGAGTILHTDWGNKYFNIGMALNGTIEAILFPHLNNGYDLYDLGMTDNAGITFSMQIFGIGLKYNLQFNGSSKAEYCNSTWMIGLYYSI